MFLVVVFDAGMLVVSSLFVVVMVVQSVSVAFDSVVMLFFEILVNKSLSSLLSMT